MAAMIDGSSGLTLVGQRRMSLPSVPTRYLVKFHTGDAEFGWRARSDQSGPGFARTEVRSVRGNCTPKLRWQNEPISSFEPYSWSAKSADGEPSSCRPWPE